MEDGSGDDLYDISVHEIINYNPDLSQCSGYTYDGIDGWTPNGSCYDIPLAQSDIAAAEDVKPIDKTYGYKTWDVTNMVRDWIANPSTNYGLLLNSDSIASSGSNRYFGSSEASDLNQRPKLVVTYTVGDDTTAPDDVSGFTAISGPGQITLHWTNPTDTDFAGVMIRFRIDGTNPQNKDDGLPIPNGNNGKIAGSPGQNMSYVHTNLDPEKHYYYSAFSYDISSNYSQTAYADAQPLSLNNAPVIQSFTGVPSSLNNPGETTMFNVFATDPDGVSLTWEQACRQRQLKKLPPIIPVVLYHGVVNWKISRKFSGMFEHPKALVPFVPDFRYLVCDLTRYSNDDIKGMVLLKVTMLLFKYI